MARLKKQKTANPHEMFYKEGPIMEYELQEWERWVGNGMFDGKPNCYIPMAQVKRLVLDNRRLRNLILEMNDRDDD